MTSYLNRSTSYIFWFPMHDYLKSIISYMEHQLQITLVIILTFSLRKQIYIERDGLRYTQIDLELNSVKFPTIRFRTFCIWICAFYFSEIHYLFLTFSAFGSVQKVQIGWRRTWSDLASNPLECSQTNLYIYIYIYGFKLF